MLTLALVNCKNKSASNGEPTQIQLNEDGTSSGKLPEGFDDFYKKFHTDSLYQMAHIQWPLQGETDEKVDSTHYKRKLINWEPNQWRMHRMNWDSKDFKQEFEVLGDLLVIERIRTRSVGYGLERRFSKTEQNEWMMIFYADIQNVQ